MMLSEGDGLEERETRQSTGGSKAECSIRIYLLGPLGWGQGRRRDHSQLSDTVIGMRLGGWVCTRRRRVKI